ncbi:MAG TPA: phospholipase A2 [Candidatus Saccharimonas sp.]|nr:phospholipase A2 [Candidatus Saccharimonas sp.]
MMSRALMVLALIAFLPVALVAAPSPAMASSSSTLTAQYPWPHNGCTGVTDNPAGASFTYACNHHDGCYAGHWASRATCDTWFRNDMINACRRLPFEMIGNCGIVANLYYYAVRLFGDKYYNSGGTLVRISTPMKIA